MEQQYKKQEHPYEYADLWVSRSVFERRPSCHICGAGNKINSIFIERGIFVASKPEIALRTLASA